MSVLLSERTNPTLLAPTRLTAAANSSVEMGAGARPVGINSDLETSYFSKNGKFLGE